MSVQSRTELYDASAHDFTTLYGNKAAFNAASDNVLSFWGVTGDPGVGVTPGTTPVAVNNTTVGGFPISQPTSPRKNYLYELQFSGAANSNQTLEIHDRLIHMGGLSGTATLIQTITGMDLSLFLATDNMAARIGDANYSDVQWWLEIYTDIGATPVPVTINVIYNDGTTGNLSGFSIGGTGLRLKSRAIQLNSFIPAADAGKYIRGINSILAAGSTGTIGSFGFVATRYRAGIMAETPNVVYTKGWPELTLPEIFNSSCLFMMGICKATSVQPFRCRGRVIRG